MFYPDNETGIDVMPEIAPKQSDTVKWFTKGGKGIEPTVPGQDTWNIWQAELLNILNLAEIRPDKSKLDQIAQAIKLIAGAVVEKEVGDGRFLEVDKNLAEIAANEINAPAAQKEARKNIGIDGDIAFRDKENTFTKPNTFKDEVSAENTLCVGKRGTKQGVLNFAASSTYFYPYVDSSDPMVVGLDIRQVLERGKAKWRFWCTDVRSLALVIGGVEFYPTLSVNNVKPDASGNITVSTGSSTDLSNYYTKQEVDSLISAGDYASATPGAVKSYGLFTSPYPIKEGDTATGSSIYFTALSLGGETFVDFSKGSQPAGIWKSLGYMYSSGGAFLAVRIS
ncbi:hypothetical protein FNI18_05950 [Salmonella enterica subsp. salamae]|nr:hypothetical protein [Salmonella enterica subsp. salamae]